MIDRRFLRVCVFLLVLCAGGLAIESVRHVGFLFLGSLAASLGHWYRTRKHMMRGAMQYFDDIAGGQALFQIGAEGIQSRTLADDVRSDWRAFTLVKHWGDTWALFRGQVTVQLFPAAKVTREIQDLFRANVVPLEKRAIRCKSCNYRLRGLSERRCPECGAPFWQPDSPVQARPIDSTRGPIE